MIYKWISELEDGFVNGVDDVLPFVKENLTELLKSSCEPQKQVIVTVMGITPIMKFIEESYTTHKNSREEPKRGVIFPVEVNVAV